LFLWRREIFFTNKKEKYSKVCYDKNIQRKAKIKLKILFPEAEVGLQTLVSWRFHEQCTIECLRLRILGLDRNGKEHLKFTVPSFCWEYWTNCKPVISFDTLYTGSSKVSCGTYVGWIRWENCTCSLYTESFLKSWYPFTLWNELGRPVSRFKMDNHIWNMKPSLCGWAYLHRNITHVHLSTHTQYKQTRKRLRKKERSRDRNSVGEDLRLPQ
jgi:hypothetical protein